MRKVVVLILSMLLAKYACYGLFSINAQSFTLGVENISVQFVQDLYDRGVRTVALVTNQSGVDQKGKRTIDLLVERGIPLHYIFAPEHGIHGLVPAGDEVVGMCDKRTKLPVISLYGKSSGKKFDEKIVEKIDLFMFDIQDAGMRHYTYISTLLELLKVAAVQGKKVVVLDRPNPLGVRMEGPLVEPHLVSFISAAPIPLRHSLTIGEIARYFNLFILPQPADLTVIPMKGYRRDSQMSKLSACLSPNICSLASCYGYSFLGLLGEIAPFDVGVGTEYAFRCIMLPDELAVSQDEWELLNRKLKNFGITGRIHKVFSNHKNKKLSGLLIDVYSINDLLAFDAFIEIVTFFIHNKNISLVFSRSFDKAIGTQEIRAVLEKKGDINSVRLAIQKTLQNFYQQVRSIFLAERVAANPMETYSILSSHTAGHYGEATRLYQFLAPFRQLYGGSYNEQYAENYYPLLAQAQDTAHSIGAFYQ